MCLTGLTVTSTPATLSASTNMTKLLRETLYSLHHNVSVSQSYGMLWKRRWRREEDRRGVTVTSLNYLKIETDIILNLLKSSNLTLQTYALQMIALLFSTELLNTVL